MGERCLLCLFTHYFPARLASRPAHVELIDSPFTLSRLFFFFFSFPSSALLFTQLVVAMLSSFLGLFLCSFPYILFIFFIFTCFPVWMRMSASLWLTISSCANFSLWLSLISQLWLSLHRSPSFCMSLSGSFMLSLPCYAALTAVTASQDLILTLLPRFSSSPLSLCLHPDSFPSFLGPRLRFLSSCISYCMQSSPCLPASLQRGSYQVWKSCSTHHLQVRIVFNESHQPKAEN